MIIRFSSCVKYSVYYSLLYAVFKCASMLSITYYYCNNCVCRIKYGKSIFQCTKSNIKNTDKYWIT